MITPEDKGIDATRRKLIMYVSIGLGLILLMAFTPVLPSNWRGLMILGGGWLMAIGGLYQVKLYSLEKDIAYYLILIFVGLIWVSLAGIMLFWLALLAGWA